MPVPYRGLVEAMTNVSNAQDKSFAAESIPPKCSTIEVQLAEWKHLFDAIDPLPFRGQYSNVADRDAGRADWQDLSRGAKDDRGQPRPASRTS